MERNKKQSGQTRKINIRVDDHLLIPFGCPKWYIEKIKVAGVSTKATYFESETPCIYINKTKKEPLTLRQATRVFPKEFPHIEEDKKAYNFLKEHIKEYTDDRTTFENRFLDLYFKYCQEALTTKRHSWFRWYTKMKSNNKIGICYDPQGNEPFLLFDALLPLPQVHLYVEDPLKEELSFIPPKMFMIDFAFWTGEKIVAVEIDGSSHVGSEEHIQKDRMLQRAGISVRHILNSELMKYGTKTIELLLPKEITEYWWNITGTDLFWEWHPLAF